MKHTGSTHCLYNHHSARVVQGSQGPKDSGFESHLGTTRYSTYLSSLSPRRIFSALTLIAEWKVYCGLFRSKRSSLQSVKLWSSWIEFEGWLIRWCWCWCFCWSFRWRVARKQPGDRHRCLWFMSGLTLSVAVMCPYGLEMVQQYAPSSPGPMSLIFRLTFPDSGSCVTSTLPLVPRGCPLRVHLGPIRFLQTCKLFSPCNQTISRIQRDWNNAKNIKYLFSSPFKVLIFTVCVRSKLLGGHWN